MITANCKPNIRNTIFTLSHFQYIGVLVIGVLVYWLLGLVKFLRLVKSLMLLKLLGVVGVVEVS
jgi:hypothetical protein